MATSITYGSYSFPEPLPLFSEQDEVVTLGGIYDHSAIRVNLVGYFTGSDLAALDLKKMQMVSGFLNEYEDLTITVENQSKTCPKSFIENIDFGESDLTTILPYNLSVLYYSGESFSDLFKVTEPVDNWSYSEGENKIITATHSVSAKGVKVDGTDAFNNAVSFVNLKMQGGFTNVALFNSGHDSFLTSRTEDIDLSNNVYGVTEQYSYSSSDDPISSNGIVGTSTSISYNSDQELSVSVQGSLQGAIDANTGSQVGLLTTGDFPPEKATEIAINAIVNSYSDYESGVYSFVSNGPSAFKYDLDTGANLLNFSFSFSDVENLDIINGDVVHKYNASVNLSRDSSLTDVSVQGALNYQGVLPINITGEFEDNARFQAIETAFSTIDPYLLAKSAIDDYTGIATGYKFNSSYLNEETVSFSIQKNPVENTLNYNYTYNNSIDYSNGSLNNLTLSIKDKTPIQLSNVQETISGFQAAEIISRTLGEYSISAQCNNQGDELDTLKNIVSGFCSGSNIISESYSTGENNISYNLAKYY